MGLREWLMILGGVILLLIIADGIRRMRKVDNQNEQMDEEERVRQEQLRRELPSGGARVVKSHDVEVFDDDPIPVLRHEVEIYSEESSSEATLNQQLSQELWDSLQSEQPYTRSPEVSEPHGDDESGLAEKYEEYPEEQSTPNSELASLDPVSIKQDLPDESISQKPEEEPATTDEALLSEEVVVGKSESSVESVENEPKTYSAVPDNEASDTESEVSGDKLQASTEALHITQFDTVDTAIDDLEPLEPLEQRFAAAKARRLEEEERQAEQKKAEAQAEAEAQEELDPVKAAIRRIQGKHTGPRPSERVRKPEPDEEMSLAERQYIQQQEAAKKAQALKLRNEQLKSEQLKQQQEKAEQAREAALKREPEQNARDAEDPLFREKRTTFRERPVTRKPLLTAEQERGQIADADELLVMHVKCKDERGFHGAALLHVVMQCGMQFGDMKVFHRFAKTEDGPQIQFSMMSSVNPGVFDIDQIDDLYIPSVSFVMGLPAPGSSQECFTMMLETAKVIVRHLNGELRDENRSVMTPQTIEHYKQRIQDFERRKQLARMR